MDRLRVLNFEPKAVKAHAKVVQFHDDLIKRNPAVIHDASAKASNPVFAEEVDDGGWIKRAKRDAPESTWTARAEPPPPKRTRFLPFRGKSVAFVGELPTLSRDEAIAKLLDAGGKLDSTVSSNTRYLVAGDVTADGNVVEYSPTFQAARRMNVDIIPEFRFLALLEPPKPFA